MDWVATHPSAVKFRPNPYAGTEDGEDWGRVQLDKDIEMIDVNAVDEILNVVEFAPAPSPLETEVMFANYPAHMTGTGFVFVLLPSSKVDHHSYSSYHCSVGDHCWKFPTDLSTPTIPSIFAAPAVVVPETTPTSAASKSPQAEVVFANYPAHLSGTGFIFTLLPSSKVDHRSYSSYYASCASNTYPWKFPTDQSTITPDLPIPSAAPAISLPQTPSIEVKHITHPTPTSAQPPLIGDVSTATSSVPVEALATLPVEVKKVSGSTYTPAPLPPMINTTATAVPSVALVPPSVGRLSSVGAPTPVNLPRNRQPKGISRPSSLAQSPILPPPPITKGVKATRKKELVSTSLPFDPLINALAGPSSAPVGFMAPPPPPKVVPVAKAKDTNGILGKVRAGMGKRLNLDGAIKEVNAAVEEGSRVKRVDSKEEEYDARERLEEAKKEKLLITGNTSMSGDKRRR